MFFKFNIRSGVYIQTPKDPPFTPVDPISHQPPEGGCRSSNGEPSRSFPEADLLLHSLFRRVLCCVYSPALPLVFLASRLVLQFVVDLPDARPIPQGPRAPSSESGPWPIHPSAGLTAACDRFRAMPDQCISRTALIARL